MKPVVNFDSYSPEYARNWLTIDRRLREQTPVAWSEAYGGFWILTRYEDVLAAARDWGTFSSENDISGTGNGGKGILIPQNTFQFALSESDPPQSTTIRSMEMPYLNANNVAKWEEAARYHASAALDAVVESGQIDFVRDLCISVPAKTVLELVGVPLDDWEIFAYSAHDMSHLPTTDPNYPHDKIKYVQRLILELVNKRRIEPREDIVSAIAHGRLNGAPLSDETAVGVLSAAVFGGFDTTTTSILNVIHVLNDRPDLRVAVLEDPKKMTAMVEEVLRLYPPGHFLGRTVVKDVEVGGQKMQPGDRVMMIVSAANHDPAKFERPDEFWLDRPNAAQHLTFSFGVHRCLGSILAKMEIRVAIETILRRIGDFHLDLDKIERYQAIGSIDGFMAMPATFTPRKKAPVAA